MIHRHRPPYLCWPSQHLRIPPRGCPSLALLVWRIRSGYTTDRDAWRVLSMASRMDRAEGELKGMREGVARLRRECIFWRTRYKQAAEKLGPDSWESS
jgi:hypothetical protein